MKTPCGAPTETQSQFWGCWECVFCVRLSWEGLTPRQRVWKRRQEISLCDCGLFIDAGEVEMIQVDPLHLGGPLQQSVSVSCGHVLYGFDTDDPF